MNNNDMVVGRVEFGPVRTPKTAENFILFDYIINDAVALRMYKALSVIALDPKISDYLAVTDPKALEQVQDALAEYKDAYQPCDAQ
jgi:hypothetical protein